jgi:hypothetical protein
MDERLMVLLSLKPKCSPKDATSQTSLEESLSTQPEVVTFAPAPGWRLLDERSGWKASPIGVHFAKSTEGWPGPS